ncbi:MULTISPECIES: hypothetical protein [Bacillus cereus group]|uniref:hypothetical protein n=1 Tax=Bacillus cereus group TaxID=86661 RepID=UPI001F59BD85|nr:MULTISPECIES: hypothetical protein [unclassified Bacillus cereus group]
MKISKKYLIISAIVIGIAILTINVVYQLTKEQKYTVDDIATKVEASKMGYKLDEKLGTQRGEKKDILSSIRLKNTETSGFANNMMIDEYEDSKTAEKNFNTEFEQSKKLNIKQYQVRKGNVIIQSYCVGGIGHAPTKDICPNYDKEIRTLENVIGKPDRIKEFDDDKEHYHSIKDVLTVEKTIDAGDFRLYRASEETRWVFYDNAIFEDDFDGFKFKINPLSLSNKSELYQNNYLGAIGSAFIINNESSSTFVFNTTQLEITTNNNHNLTQNSNTNMIKTSLFNPGDKINDPKQGIITFISNSTNLESADWVNFKFEIAKLNKDRDVIQRKKYNVKFNITKHFIDNEGDTKQAKVSTIESPIQESNSSKPEVKGTHASENKHTVSKEEFNRIQNGMTYEQVKDIIGSDGTILSESGEKGTEFYTIMYKWEGEGSIGANANFMFQNNKLMNKAQFGLK